MIGKDHKGALMSMVERLYGAVSCKNALAVMEVMTSGIAPREDKVFTVIVENGREFTLHEKIAGALSLKVYFAHPCASWERGVNENANGLIRQYFSKSRKLTGITTCFRTPHEVFFGVSERPAVVTGA